MRSTVPELLLKMAEQMEDVGMTTAAAQEQELLAGIQPS